MGEKKLNSAGASHAASLVAAGKIANDKSWSAPSAAADDAYIKEHSMSEYGKWFMGIDPDMDADKKGHFAYPFSADFEKVSLRGLRAIIGRAGQAGAKAIEEKAQSLYDEAKKKAGSPQARTETAVSKICARKALERMTRSDVLVKKAESGGFTTNDLFYWINNELDDVEFPPSTGSGPDGPGCYCVYPVNCVLPEHEKGETWQAIVGCNGSLYSIDFTLGDAGVTFVGKPVKVANKDQYVILDDIVEEASDEAAGRTDKEKKARRIPAGRMQRIFEVDPQEVDEESLELPVSFSSELPGLQRCGGAYGDDPSEFERAAGIRSGQVYIEILDHDDPDYSTLNNHGAVLDEHDEKDQIGVVVPNSARLDKTNRVSRARLRMDKGEKGRMRFRQMKDMIRPHLSAGYKHTGYVGKETLPDGRTAHRFKFRGLEITSCAVPMDGTIGYGRSYKELPQVDSEYKEKKDSDSAQPTETKDKTMTEAEIKAAAEAEAAQKIKDAEKKGKAEGEATARTAVAGEERTRFSEISKIRDELVKNRKDQEPAIRKLADEAIGNGMSVDSFKMRAMEDILNAKAAPKNSMEAMGYDEEDRSRFSLKRAIQNIIKQAEGGKQGVREPDPDTFEGEVCTKMRKAYEKSGTPCVGHGTSRGNGFLVPHDANLSPRAVSRREINKMQRDATMQATVFGQGGAAVATELLLPIVEVLRNEMVTDKLGVTSMAGLEGNIVIPRQVAAATAYAVAETTALTLSGQVLDQIPLSPKRVGAWANYSKQFLLQSSLDVENFIRTDLFAVIALAWDEYILNGQGGQDQPTGILPSQGVQLVNGNGIFTGYSGDANAPSWADIVNFDTQLNKVNARRQGRGWATTSNSRGRLETLAKLLVGATTVAAQPLWEADVEPMGRMKGYPAIDSQQVPNDVLIFGVWALNVIHALWGGLDIVVDPYSLSTQGIVKIVMNTWGDVALRHPQEFCISLNPASA